MMKRVSYLVLLLLLPACPKDKKASQNACDPIDVSFPVGSSFEYSIDPCRTAKAIREGGVPGIDFVNWRFKFHEIHLNHFKIEELPWFVTYDFNEWDNLVLTADIHAPRQKAARADIWHEVHVQYQYDDEYYEEDNDGVRQSVVLEGEGPVRIRLTPPEEQRFNMTISTTAGGHVEDAFISCTDGSGICEASYGTAEELALQIVPNAGFLVAEPLKCGDLTTSFNGDGSAELSGILSADTACVVEFEPTQGNNVLAIADVVNGMVQVAAQDRSETCTGTCQYSFPAGTDIGIEAIPDPNYQFAGWNGACAGMGDSGTIKISEDMSCSPRFVLEGYLPVRVNVVGLGEVFPSGQSGSCTADRGCDLLVREGQSLTLTAQPDVESQSTFVGWSGCASGDANPLELTITEDTVCTAHFEEAQCSGPTPPTEGQIEVLDMNDNILGTPVGGARDCAFQAPASQAIRLRAAGFQSTAGGELLYSWDTEWDEGQPHDDDAWGRELILPATTSGCVGIHLVVEDECNGSVQNLFVTINRSGA